MVCTDEIAGRARNDELMARNDELMARNDELMARNDELMARNDVSGHPGLDPGSGSSVCIDDFSILPRELKGNFPIFVTDDKNSHQIWQTAKTDRLFSQWLE